MNAIIAREKAMSDDGRIAKLEANLDHLQSDVTDMKGTLEWLRQAFESFKAEVAREFGVVRTEVTKEIGSFRTEVTKEIGSFKAEVTKEIGSFKADVTNEIGSVRISIERAKLWMVVTGVGTILSVWGAALALARFLKP